MIKREIVQQLKQDIYTLVNIARSYAPDSETQDAITVAENCIHAGLIDYELACKEAFDMGLERGRAQVREQQRG